MTSLTFFPLRTEAGIFDALTSVFGKKVEQKEEKREVDSQTIPLPKPSRSVDPENTGGGDFLLANGTALLADSGPLGTQADVSEGGKNGKIETYIVQKGDTLGEIADQFDVSINTIKWANDIKGNVVREGQELVILPVTGVRYTVKNGGSIKDIVKKYGGDSYEAARYNGVGEDEDLKPGTVVIIPDASDFAYEDENQKKVAKKPGIRSGQTSRLRGAGGPAYVGYYVHPLNGLGTKTQGLHGYNGIDIGAARGTPVIASAAGTVVVSRQPGWNGGYGAYVVLQHDNDTQTLYAHLDDNYSSLGDRVTQGQQLGTVGSTGKSTGSHLHFEIRGAKNPF